MLCGMRLNCDEKYDGLFIYAVKSTGILSRTPLKENIAYYPSISLAINDGYRPYKRCRPDFKSSYDEDIVTTTKQFIKQEYHNSLSLDRLALYWCK
jgi:AraC family transcriptional regulator, regulatory protein of adaptative response / methylphosphotriester-DNA alkyltransferase methyltransferase